MRAHRLNVYLQHVYPYLHLCLHLCLCLFDPALIAALHPQHFDAFVCYP